MRLAIPNDVKWMIKHYSERNKSSFVMLSSAHGYSQSELNVILSGKHDIYVMEPAEETLMLSVHDMDTQHRQARIQFCANKEHKAPKYFFQSLIKKHQLCRITSYVFPDEKDEIHILNALGFVKEATFREHIFLAGRYTDIIIYGYYTGAL